MKWKTTRHTSHEKKFSFGTPLVIDVDGKKQIVSQASGAVFGYSLEGKELWRFNYDGFSVVPKPLYDHGLVYVSSGFNKATLYAIDPKGSGDITSTNLVWSFDREVPRIHRY